MTKEQVLKLLVTFVVLLFAVSAVGYLIFPSAMLSVVGIVSDAQTDFLVRALAAALVALIPSAWSVRTRGNPSLYRAVILGMVIYLFVSSAVDLHAFLTHLVNSTSIPSMVLRVLLGAVLLWLMPQE